MEKTALKKPIEAIDTFLKKPFLKEQWKKDKGLKNLISSKISAHDQRQIEFSFDISTKADNKLIYQIDIYFFLPKSFGINPQSYSEERFYDKITNYLRIHTPPSFGGPPENKQIKLEAAELYFKEPFTAPKDKILKSQVIQEVKIFGCYIDSLLKKLRTTVDNTIEQSRGPSLAESQKMKEDISNILQELDLFRENYILIVKNRTKIDSDIKEAFLLIDEYLSNRMQSSFSYLHNFLNSEEHLEKNHVLKSFIIKTLQNGVDYLHANKYLTLESNLKDSAQELYFYRQGLLKKYVYDVLYLEVEKQKREKTYKNIIASIAAAFAALWAGVTEIQRIRLAQGGTIGLNLNFITLILIGVIAYVFKDQIKEFTKEYFHDKLKKRLPDFSTNIFYRTHKKSKQQHKLGLFNESLRYVPFAALPKKIKALRLSGSQFAFEPDRKEFILNYYKSIFLNYKEINKNLPHVESIKDIMRVNISDILDKLDDPKKTLYYYDNEKGPSSLVVPKVYHLNIILKYSVYPKDQKNVKKVVRKEKFRVILNKEGILRLEKVKI